MPEIMVRCFQKADMNNLSLSETMSNGRPFLQYQWLKNKTMSSFAVSLVDVGMMRMSEPSQSVMVRIQSCPSSKGRGPSQLIDNDHLRLGGGEEVLWV